MKYLKHQAYLKSIQNLSRKLSLRPWREKVAAGRMRGYPLGFTLIEILVVVLIIGILGAIAVPQYQRALLKSRYAALMPIAKSMANSNEAYYLEHGIYADDPQDLLIQGQSRYTDDTELEFGTVSDYAYVLAKNEDKIPNNTFVVYQKHSGEFPGEIHCEALANNDLAESVCKSFGGNESIGKTLTDGYETYVLFGTGNGVAPTGDNGGEEPEEPETPTCEGAAPIKQEACSSGCGSVTVTAACEEGEWVYPTADMSSCPVKPNDETVECGTGFTGNKTRTATCNSAGTAWEFTDNWNTSGCTAVPTCSGSQPANITSSTSGATGIAHCDTQSGEWVYEWTGGAVYEGFWSTCSGDSAYACAGSTFSGKSSRCVGEAANACAGSTFSGESSACFGTVANGCESSTFSGRDSICYGEGANSCANSTFSGQNSTCVGEAANGCAGSTFSGKSSHCNGKAANGCAGTTIQAGASCSANASGGCDGAKYGEDPTGVRKGIGSCYDDQGFCPTGVPLSGNWNETTQSYNISGWKGGYCDPSLMVSGACPAGSPKQGGGCWDGNGNQTDC